jgi:hypothetical protein
MTNSRSFYGISKKGIRDNVNTGTAQCASALWSSKASIKKGTAFTIISNLQSYPTVPMMIHCRPLNP